VFGLVVITAVFLMAVFAGVISPHDPQIQDLENRLMPPVWSERGGWDHVLGTDQLGRDILSRIIYGSRISIFVGLTVVVISGIIGVTLGLISGYYGGWMSSLIMRVVDLQIAFPFILMAIIIIAVLGPGLMNVILALSISRWMGYARLIRGQTLLVKEQDYVKAAKLLGARDSHIIFFQILPNVITHAIVLATFAIAQTMITEAGLTYLGLGVEPSIPSWGGMLSDGRDYLGIAWWIATFPGLCIMLCVLAVNLMGEWLRDALDPHVQR
jgi:peptide/nickel transport system permease protein